MNFTTVSNFATLNTIPDNYGSFPGFIELDDGTIYRKTMENLYLMVKNHGFLMFPVDFPLNQSIEGYFHTGNPILSGDGASPGFNASRAAQRPRGSHHGAAAGDGCGSIGTMPGRTDAISGPTGQQWVVQTIIYIYYILYYIISYFYIILYYIVLYCIILSYIIFYYIF